MKKPILLTIIIAGFIIIGCGNSNSQSKLKDMSEIEKLTKEQFAEETAAIHIHTMREMENLLDKYTKIDADFEKDMDKLYSSSVKQMIQYGKVLAKKDEETRDDYLLESSMAAMSAMEKIEPEATDFENKFDNRLPELQAYGSEKIGQMFKHLFGIMDFMDFERIKEDYPESAKEFGIE